MRCTGKMLAFRGVAKYHSMGRGARLPIANMSRLLSNVNNKSLPKHARVVVIGGGVFGTSRGNDTQ